MEVAEEDRWMVVVEQALPHCSPLRLLPDRMWPSPGTLEQYSTLRTAAAVVLAIL